MANQTQPFRQHHVTRLLKAASAAGVPNPSVEVHLLPGGTKFTVGGGKTGEQRPARFAEGGTTRMHKPQAAGPALAGQTGKNQPSAPGAKRAIGGPPVATRSTATPAGPGRTGSPADVRKGR